MTPAMDLHGVLTEKLNSALAAPAMVATRRDLELPALPGKVHAVIGMRRAGKTTFLHQVRSERRARLGAEQVLYFGFDDDRLAGIDAGQLSLLVEEYYRRYPDARGSRTVHWLFDEIQLVPGWDRFVRRLLDTERVEVVVSGSSAQMLSREVHTSLRGRGFETVVSPFSFREFLRHVGDEPERPPKRWTPAERSRIDKRFREYLGGSGFPEAIGLSAPLRVQLLQGYVDLVMFRDVVERHAVAQVAALRWLVRHGLRNPARPFSVHRLTLDLRAQGHAIGKETVTELFDQLQDAFLFTAMPLATESERRRNSNPRRLYPIDHGLVGAFDSSGRANLGHVLEVVVHAELVRRRADLGYVVTEDGLEVDFLSRRVGEREELIQVCADPGEPTTLAKETRALVAARREHSRARARLLVLDRQQAEAIAVPGIRAEAVPEWLLSEREER